MHTIYASHQPSAAVARNFNLMITLICMSDQEVIIVSPVPPIQTPQGRSDLSRSGAIEQQQIA
jgi:hypothetical protein